MPTPIPPLIPWSTSQSVGKAIGTIVAFAALQAAIFRPIMGLLNVGVQWVTAMALFSRIFEYLDLVPEITPPELPVAIDPTAVRGELRFEGVGFSYDGGARVLSGVDLLVPAGTATAIVGATGSGKSTLGSLVPRLHDTIMGRVAIDGIDVRDLSPNDLARIVGFVSQESCLVHASIRESLLTADPDADERTLWSALEATQIDGLIASLPDQLDTLVGARGRRFAANEVVFAS